MKHYLQLQSRLIGIDRPTLCLLANKYCLVLTCDDTMTFTADESGSSGTP